MTAVMLKLHAFVGLVALTVGTVLILAGAVIVIAGEFKGSTAAKAAGTLPGPVGATARIATAATPRRRQERAQTRQAAETRRTAPVRAAARSQAREERAQAAHTQRMAQARTRHRRAGTAAAQRVRHREETHGQAMSRRQLQSVFPEGRYPREHKRSYTPKPLPEEAPF